MQLANFTNEFRVQLKFIGYLAAHISSRKKQSVNTKNTENKIVNNLIWQIKLELLEKIITRIIFSNADAVVVLHIFCRNLVGLR